MKWHWTTETYGYALRNPDNAPFALVTRAKDGYTAALIRPGFPSNGPFRAPQTATDHAEKMARRLAIIAPSDSVGAIPETRKRA